MRSKNGSAATSSRIPLSARRVSLRLAPTARRDYEDILLYTRRTHGAEQKTRYRAILIQAVLQLAAYPLLGRARDDLYPGCRSLRVDQHTIYYQVNPSEIAIVRILHGRQDAAGKVKAPEP